MIQLRVLTVCIATCGPALAQSTTLVSANPAGLAGNSVSTSPAISADGRYVAFVSTASDLVPGDTNSSEDVFVRDRQSGATTRVSVDSAGVQQVNTSGYSSPSISADGRFVAFGSTADNLVPADTNITADIFVHDRQTGLTTRVNVSSAGAQALGLYGESYWPSISADGRYVSFASLANNLVPVDVNTHPLNGWDIFVHDRQTGVTKMVNLDSAGVQGVGVSQLSALSADGRYVAFESTVALTPGDVNGKRDIFVHDNQTGVTEIASVDSLGMSGNADSSNPAISSDGRCVAFSSRSTNFTAGVSNGGLLTFVHDRQTGITECVSVDPTGVAVGSVSGATVSLGQVSISADGRYVSFDSQASTLVAGDTNNCGDTFVRDRLAGVTTRVSLTFLDQQCGAPCDVSSMSADGRHVAFESFSGTLAPGDTNGTWDVFVRDRGQASAFTPLCLGDGSGGACPCANTGNPGHGCENSGTTGGAILTATGHASLSADTVQLASSGELPNSMSLVLQGSRFVAPVGLGGGLFCAGGALKRLYLAPATGGIVHVPQVGDPSISAQSIAFGDPIALGTTRVYQVYYRDANLLFCASGANLTNAIAIAWGG